jgi:hypothetical protein
MEHKPRNIIRIFIMTSRRLLRQKLAEEFRIYGAKKVLLSKSTNYGDKSTNFVGLIYKKNLYIAPSRAKNTFRMWENATNAGKSAPD